MGYGQRKHYPCPCGKVDDAYSWWEYDARGIPLCRVCDHCVEEKLSHYRPEVLNNSSYHADEPIEED